MHLRTHSAAETEEFGRQVASAHIDLGKALSVLYLTGDLGAGKTTFARGFLRGLGAAGAVRSPTYTLLELHELGTLTVLHVDLYRVHDESELEPLGLRDWARSGCLWLIEWPERASRGLPPPDLVLSFSVGSTSHEIEVQPQSAAGQEWLAGLGAVRAGGSASGAPGPAQKPGG